MGFNSGFKGLMLLSDHIADNLMLLSDHIADNLMLLQTI